MPRTARASVGGVCYHVLNRGNARTKVFHKASDYADFVDLLVAANERVSMRLLAYVLMPNHFHLVLWPRRDGDLSRYMQWLLTSHVRRYHRQRRTSGHVWQGRFKAFPIEEDEHLLTVVRYVERNPLRASLVRHAEKWAWSSLAWRVTGVKPEWLSAWPVLEPRDWMARVNQALTDREMSALKRSIARGTPFGDSEWSARIARRLGLESSLRPRGRPPKVTKK